MCVEEMAELTQALMHWRREKATSGVVAEEVADVFIMVYQMRLLFDKEVVDRLIQGKLTRLRQYLESDGYPA